MKEKKREKEKKRRKKKKEGKRKKREKRGIFSSKRTLEATATQRGRRERGCASRPSGEKLTPEVPTQCADPGYNSLNQFEYVIEFLLISP